MSSYEERAIRGDELFGKGYEGNLSKRSLRNASKKDREEIVECNLPFLAQFYFFGSEKDHSRWNDTLFEVLGSEKFLSAFEKILKKNKKAKKKRDSDEMIEIPKGMHVIFMDYLRRIDQLYREKIRRYQGSKSEFGQASMDELRSQIDDQKREIQAIIEELCGKEKKLLLKYGINEPYATRLATTMVPHKYLNEHNVRRYFNSLNRAITDCVRHGVVKSEDDPGVYDNSIGINLALDENIVALYEFFFFKVDRKVFLSALKEFLLEPRTKALDNFTKPQLEAYNSLNRVVCDILEGNIAINYTGENMKKKELKELRINKKELKKIMRKYAEKRMKDDHDGRDCTRRILFRSLDEESYPNLTKAFDTMIKDSLVDAEDQRQIAKEKAEEQRQREQQNKQNQQNNNNGNRNNNNFRKNR